MRECGENGIIPSGSTERGETTTDGETPFAPPEPYGLLYTGERHLPWSDDFITAYEHVHRYLYATRYTAGKRVLDIACGEGYGTRMLAREASWVLGVDADAATLAHARQHHGSDNTWFVRADAQHFHLAPHSIDVIVSFETLEHFPAQREFLDAMKACLVPGGLLLLSTPNRRVYTGDAPIHNPFHTREFDRAELLALLEGRFAHVEVCGQQMIASSIIAQMADERFPRRGSSFAPLPTVVDPGDLDYPVTAEAGVAPRYFLVLCSDAPLPPMPATFLFDNRQTLWEHLQTLEPQLGARVYTAEKEAFEARALLHEEQHRAWSAETKLAHAEKRVWEVETELTGAEKRVWEVETELADVRHKFQDAETRARELETTSHETSAQLRETHNQLAIAEAQLTRASDLEQRLREQRASLVRSLLNHPPVGPPPHVLVLIPGGMNYFYDQAGRRLAESLASLGLTVDLHSLKELPEVHRRYDWTLVVNVSEVLIAYGVEDPIARREGRMTPEEQARALARLARVREGSKAIGAVQLDSAGTYWFDHACNLCAIAGIPTVFDLGFHDQSVALLSHQRPRYHFLFNGLTESERAQLDALPVEDDRPVPWVFVGHLTPDRTNLVQRLMQEVDPCGFVYMPMLAPFVEGGPHLDEAQFATVLSRARYQVWRSHHTHFYLESERFRQSALAGGVPVKLMTATPPPGPLPFRDFLLDEETFAATLHAWDFTVMRRRIADEFRALPSLDDSLLAALAARSPARLYGT